MGFCNYYSGYVEMYAELSGPLHKMLQVGKFDGRKGSKKKLSWGYSWWTRTRDLCYGQTPRTML